MRLPRLVSILAAPVSVLCGQPLDAVFVLETSPGTEQAIALIRPAAFREGDRIGVVGFERNAGLLQPLTEDRDAIATALQRAGIRVVAGVNGVPVRPDFPVDLAGAVMKACNEFARDGSPERKRVIIVYFAGEDPSLGRRADDLRARVKMADARVYAVLVPRVDTAPLAMRPRIAPSPVPIVTSQIVSRLAADSGGRIYKRNWELAEILAAARK